MSINRREFLIAGLATAVVAGCSTDSSGKSITLGEQPSDTMPDTPTDDKDNDSTLPDNNELVGEGTTLRRTIVAGEPINPQGYCELEYGPGEPHLLRTDLGAEPTVAREERRQGVLSFVQFTDVHLVDAQSPARVEYLDRLSDKVGDDAGLSLFKSSYRAHEMLTVHVTNALVRAVNKVAKGPITGMPLGFTICTGDNADTCQHNEQRWFIDTLDGNPVTPDSGAPDRWEGVADDNPSSYDTHYWHPHGTPAGAIGGDDAYRRDHGFPTVPGLLDAVRRELKTAGLDMPWYTCYGNHDGLWQGNFPKGLAPLNGIGGLLGGLLGDDDGLEQMLFTILSTGNIKVTSLPVNLSPDDVANFVNNFDLQGLLTNALSSGAGIRLVTADTNRRLISRQEIIEEHFNTTTEPVGHGFTQHNRDANLAYYTFDLPGATVPMLGITLDTVNPNGYADGSIDGVQLAWLEEQLMQASSRYLSTSGEWLNGIGEDKLIVIFSHHTIDSMNNPLVATGGNVEPRILGGEVRDLLLRFPNVILWVNGHTHHNKVVAHGAANNGAAGGFWEINTASHIDWPQQVRLIELVDNNDGTLSIFGTIVDADAPLAWGGDLNDPVALASLSRELAINDPQSRTAKLEEDPGGRGVLEDRNVELVVANPLL